MGCCSATLRRSMIPAAADVSSTRSLLGRHVILDFKMVIQQNQELKMIVELYKDTIIPGIKSNLAAVVQRLEDLLSGVAVIRHRAFDDKKVNAYAEIVAALKEAILFPHPLVSGALEEETMGLLRLLKDRITRRRRSIKRRRRVWTAAVMAVAIALLMISVGLALAGAAPVVIAAAAAAATAVKTVEPLANTALEEEERKLKEEEEVVEMIRDGEWLMVHEFNGVQRQMNKLLEEIMVEYLNLAKHIQAAEEKAVPEMEKMIDEVKNSAKDLKGKLNAYADKIEQFQSQFMRMIKN